LTATSLPSLHLPDEPTARAEAWLDAIVEGEDLVAVLGAEDGFAAWLWARWSTLATVGVTREEFEQIVEGYRREIWLWLAGERIWTQCCAGLAGRVSRRIVAVDIPGK
jgi:hypothetical protein